MARFRSVEIFRHQRVGKEEPSHLPRYHRNASWARKRLSGKAATLRALAARLAEVEEKRDGTTWPGNSTTRCARASPPLGLTLTLLQARMSRERGGKTSGAAGRSRGPGGANRGRPSRDVMAELRPPMLDDYAPALALHWYGAEFSR